MDKRIIKGLIALNQSQMPYQAIERDEPLPIDRKKIITVPGVRRCGKSYKMKITVNALLKKGIKTQQILWLGFDDERLLPMEVNELDDLLNAYREMYPDQQMSEVYMFFDEIQLIKGWEYFVLRVYKNYCQNIWISGSNATMLSTELVSALRGYPLEYKTYPLSFSEYCRFRNLMTDSWLESDQAKLSLAFEGYNSGSAFPEVVLTEDLIEKTKILQGYYDTMLLKDVAEHYGISNLKVLRYLCKRMMGNVTKPTSINSIYNDIKSQGLKVGKNDLYRWTDCLCDVFMFMRLPIFTESLKEKIRGQEKYYVIDNGLRQAVLMPLSQDNGKLLENTVFLHLTRRLKPFEHLTYYKGRKECDFVVQQADTVTKLIQVTWDIHESETRQREIDGLIEASDRTGCQNLSMITSDTTEDIPLPDGRIIHVIPASHWLLST
ncbi:MAG: ATP-binding protein [Bacteroidales bacterium]|nr:ATP-binding protein [Bacteroidales bacterium]